MQQHNMSWIEVQFLKKAVDVLCQCRQTLMYTYVFAFYLHRNNQSIIFEVFYFISYFVIYLGFLILQLSFVLLLKAVIQYHSVTLLV